MPNGGSNSSYPVATALLEKRGSLIVDGIVCRIDTPAYFDNTRIMETLNAAELLAALGHESRLAVFRLLVEAGAEGVNASAIGERLQLAPATLSFHLAHLSRVGLIKGRQESRFIYYSTDFAVMDELLSFLTSNCCQGKACLPKTSSRKKS